MKKIFFFIVLVLTGNITAWGQTHAVWSLARNEGFSFSSGNVVNINLVNPVHHGSAICTFTGKLDLYSSYHQLFYASGSPVVGWVGINTANSFRSNGFMKVDNYRYGILYS